MSLQYDHIVIAVNDLEQASADFARVGFRVIPGGEHANGVTHNALVSFDDGAYFELIAFKRPGDNPEPHKWWEKLRQREGTVDFALLSENLAEEAERLRAAGIAVDGPTANGRVRPDGERLDWRTISLRAGDTPFPFLIDDQTPRELRVPPAPATSQPLGVTGVRGLVLLTTNLAESARWYKALLGNGGEMVAPSIPGAVGAMRFLRGNQWLELVEPDNDQAEWLAFARDRGAGAWEIVLGGGPHAEETLPLAETHGARIRIDD